jgi:IS30 family transposase
VRWDAEQKLREGWTPEIISGRARLEGRPWVCKETIYKHVYADAKAGGDLWKHLPRAHRKRRRRCPRVEGRGRGKIPNQRMIDTRPAEVESRATVGHWEGDLINGAAKTGHLVTAVDPPAPRDAPRQAGRNTRFTLVGRTDSKEASEVRAVIESLLAPLQMPLRLSVTLDNGKEFARHEEIAGATGLDVFFAIPVTPGSAARTRTPTG